jgi:serine/threonine-protein kinase
MKICPKCQLRFPNDSTSCFIDGAALLPMRDPRIGTTIAGKYFIEEVLGEGGMATVYRARHKLVDRPCAVKIMSPSLARDKVVRERFRREAKAAQKLAHPNIIEIFDHGDTDDGTSYIVMELLHGEPLCDIIARGPMPIDRALGIMVQMARALARAHDFEVVHRDLKPDNIFISIDTEGGDLVKLLDFGIARSMQDSRLTGVGEVFGTPQYMAPERITSIDAGPPADLYSLGIIYFEMMTATLPFDAPDIPSFFVKHMKEAPPKLRSRAPEAPEALEVLIDQLLAKEVRQRPVDAHRVHNDLIALCGALGVLPPADPTASPQSVRGPAPTLPPAAIDAWARRTAVFDEMLRQAFGTQAPGDLMQQLEQIRQLVRGIGELRKTSMIEQRALESLESKERDGRQRFGFAMDSLGLDASAARDAARAAQESASEVTARATEMVTKVKAAHSHVVFWEGRSGFQEPYRDLSEAYRSIADLIDEWLTIRVEEKQALTFRDERAKAVVDLEFQIKELRSALSTFEHSVEDAKRTQEQNVIELNRRAEAAEAELLQHATKFCAPLRQRPELSELFRQLEQAA